LACIVLHNLMFNLSTLKYIGLSTLKYISIFDKLFHLIFMILHDNWLKNIGDDYCIDIRYVGNSHIHIFPSTNISQVSFKIPSTEIAMLGWQCPKFVKYVSMYFNFCLYSMIFYHHPLLLYKCWANFSIFLYLRNCHWGLFV